MQIEFLPEVVKILKERNRLLEENLHNMMQSRPDLDVGPIQLPLEIHLLVAEFLAGDDAYGTLAGYTIACKILRQEMMPVLLETVVVTKAEWLRWDNGDYTPEALFKREGRHTKHLVIHLSEFGPHNVIDLFPNRALEIWRSTVGYERAVSSETLSLSIWKPVSALLLERFLQPPVDIQHPDDPTRDVQWDPNVSRVWSRRAGYCTQKGIEPVNGSTLGLVERWS
ncbi:hypothetical protein QFC21_006051 [Naganishia friedmannii]|uniref:Uncharacterized protein n=1 Tax=Naganishia friedmannii TaxID=89922 RepID=A0ACC2V4B9_9TREE|nr:hypothetical protein QFC21_006051 [Naganishia friedmannii]